MFISLCRPLLWQSGAVCSAALIGALLGGTAAALAVLYGGGVAVTIAAMLIWRWRQGESQYHSDAARHLRSFYRSGLERFFVAGLLLAAGFGLLGMHAPGLLAGFLVGQLAWMLASLTMHERT